ncbi:MAG: hypothetical protein ACK5IP_00595, partial [Paracoccus sp. (in: a-proteobacteria)]
MNADISRMVLAIALTLFGAGAPAIAQEAAAPEAQAAGTQPVRTGYFIRGLTINGPAGTPGQKTGTTCDFSDEPVSGTRHLEGASVNCRPDGNVADTLDGLPPRFNAYCAIRAAGLPNSWRVIQAPVPG